MAMASNIIRITGAREVSQRAPRTVRREMDTLVVSPAVVEKWRKPTFQRDLRVTRKVREVAGVIRREGVIPGIVTLGVMQGDTYLIDGQHRIEGLRMACDRDFRVDDDDGQDVPFIKEAYADVRIGYYESMADMGEEFVEINSALVRMKNDDILRGLEGLNPHLAAIRRKCPFIGYDRVRTGDGRVLISMATSIRVWFGSVGNVPNPGPSSTDAANMLDSDNVTMLTDFMSVCFESWGRGKENFRLWTSVNLGILMWLWRRAVLGEGANAATRTTPIGRPDFGRCLMALSANQRYVDWLVGRSLKDRDRSPCYARIRDIFATRLTELGQKKPRFPQDDWTKT